MIVFRLRCPHEHEFDAWFQNSTAYDAQARAGEIACPECGSVDVDKAVMAPRVKPADEQTAGLVAHAKTHQSEEVQFRQWAKKMRRHIEQTFDYVGDTFPDEARKIHAAGDDEGRRIYGNASLRDVKELTEEGIAVLPVPDPDPKPRKKVN